MAKFQVVYEDLGVTMELDTIAQTCEVVSQPTDAKEEE